MVSEGLRLVGFRLLLHASGMQGAKALRQAGEGESVRA